MDRSDAKSSHRQSHSEAVGEPRGRIRSHNSDTGPFDIVWLIAGAHGDMLGERGNSCFRFSFGRCRICVKGKAREDELEFSFNMVAQENQAWISRLSRWDDRFLWTYRHSGHQGRSEHRAGRGPQSRPAGTLVLRRYRRAGRSSHCR